MMETPVTQPKVSSRLSSTSRISTSISRRVQRDSRFGDYTLGSTLGEGEFGKVKLGWKQAGDQTSQAAIKLIRKDTIPPKSSREIKVFREINALKILHHPNIVKLEQVIQNEKYIGIVLEYASGGELFDHIIEHRYLKDPVAARLFSQLVSGVHYLHSKGIVHRDLKLENLLLDKNKNVIITDFGFANSFRKGGHQLMATSCGSPCYAAPELVVSDKKYDGRKVDVWSCGVILYAMLAGYLPFDDDPDNPDSENITKLYKYITSTPLTFPEYFPPVPRDLLRRVLVPDPEKRISLADIRAHAWLAPHAAFMSVTPREWDDIYRARAETASSGAAGPDGSASTRGAAAAAAASHRQSAQATMSRSHSTRVKAVPMNSTMSSRNHTHVRSSSVMPVYSSLSTSAPSKAMIDTLGLDKTTGGSMEPPMPGSNNPFVHATQDYARSSTDVSVAGSDGAADEVSSLGIAPPPERKTTKLPAPRTKPRPTSFQPSSSSSTYNPDPSHAFSLYSPRASQPRVEVTQGISKSGEISRPQSYVQNPRTHARNSLSVSGQDVLLPEFGEPLDEADERSMAPPEPSRHRHRTNASVDMTRSHSTHNSAHLRAGVSPSIPGPADHSINKRASAVAEPGSAPGAAAAAAAAASANSRGHHRRGSSIAQSVRGFFGGSSTSLATEAGPVKSQTAVAGPVPSRYTSAASKRQSAIPVATTALKADHRKRYSMVAVPSGAVIMEESAAGSSAAYSQPAAVRQQPSRTGSSVSSQQGKEQSAARKMFSFLKRRSAVPNPV